MTPHPGEVLIRTFYAARARGDREMVRGFLAPGVVWHEAGSRPPYTGSLHGPEAVMAMIDKALEVTNGTFRLDLHDVLANDRHVVALVEWTATREDRELSGREAAIFHVEEAWFHPDVMEAVNEFWQEAPEG
jgi:ketosteroid isomerase-like protein